MVLVEPPVWPTDRETGVPRKSEKPLLTT